MTNQEIGEGGRTRLRRAGRWLTGALGVLFAIKLVKIVMIGTATAAVGVSGLLWYTSRPEFCTSCHNMQPYYDSWSHSSHKSVTCVACHFPPGVEGFVTGKIAALSQVAKYFTNTSGPKPFAHVRDESCMRSGCHSIAGLVPTQSTPAFKAKFDHTKHLKASSPGGPAYLTCASCHTQVFREEHMTVNRTACYLCHLRADAPDERSKCTLCHELPGVVKIDGGTFDHRRIEKAPVQCTACHAGLTEGAGKAPKQRCLQCHNSQENLAKVADPTFLHDRHVKTETISCLDCHLEIRHSLESQWVERSTSCETCHPKHHENERRMLAGISAVDVEAIKSPMFKVRAGCLACHMSVKHANGEVVLTADPKACEQCHDKGFGDILEGWKSFGLERGAEVAGKLEGARKKLEQFAGDPKVKADAEQSLRRIEANLQLVKLGRTAHNFPYAEAIFDEADHDLEALDGTLGSK